MMVFAEQVAIELAMTVSFGAIFGFVSGLLSTPRQDARRQTCCRRSPVAAIEAGLDQVDPCKRLRS
jgi:hypothetical protein